MSAPKILISNRDGSLWQRFLLCTLCLCAWRGPLPIVHQHTFEIAALATSPALREHAVEYHAQQLTCPPRGWHWHVVFPANHGNSDDENSELSTIDDASNLRLGSEFEHGFADRVSSNLIPSPVSIDRSESRRSTQLGCEDPAWGQRSFLSTYRSHSFRSLLGLALC